MDRETGTKYGDIINRARPVSRYHEPMPRWNRAGQFAPFAALTGYGEAVEEARRVTGRRMVPGADRIELLDRQLRYLRDHGGDRVVTVTYFLPDGRKSGGAYEVVTGVVEEMDPVRRRLVLRVEEPGGSDWREQGTAIERFNERWKEREKRVIGFGEIWEVEGV